MNRIADDFAAIRARMAEILRPAVADECPGCDGHGHYLASMTRSDEDLYIRECETCGGTGKRQAP